MVPKLKLNIVISYGQIDEACDDGNVQYDYLKQKNES